MFALFFSLYYSMFNGAWSSLTLSQINGGFTSPMNKVFYFLSTFFSQGSTGIAELGLSSGDVIFLVAYVLALITSIGIVVMAVKGIKRVFSVFFMGVR